MLVTAIVVSLIPLAAIVAAGETDKPVGRTGPLSALATPAGPRMKPLQAPERDYGEGGIAPPADEREAEVVLFQDPFQRHLEDGWKWLRDVVTDRRVEAGVLHMWSRPGGLWKQENSLNNMVLRPLPKSDGNTLAIEVGVSNQPSAPYENAGIVLYYDDDHYVALIKEFMRGDLVVAMSREVEAEGETTARQPYKETDVWLRMEVSGGNVKSFYRAQKDKRWTALGECRLPNRDDAKIGLFAAYGHPDVEHWVQFRDFRILTLP